ncbi:MAG: FkbM family methyltransferase [Planctomycetota bacterium]
MWSRTELLSINNAGGSTTKVIPASASGDPARLVQGVALDDVLANADPNYIKMDIEGGEFDALQGMHSVLTACRPRLAVCVYHHPSDLWRIPLMIADILPDYRMHLRMHGELMQEIVLYCIPNEPAR